MKDLGSVIGAVEYFMFVLIDCMNNSRGTYTNGYIWVLK